MTINVVAANPRSTQELLKIHELIIRPVHDAKGALDAVLNANDGYDDERLREARESLLVALARVNAYVQDQP